METSNKKYIDADALLAWYYEMRKHEREIINSTDYHKEIKDEARTTIAILDKMYFKVEQLKNEVADVEEVKHGRWRLFSPFTDTYECDKCGYQVIDESFKTSYCPWCGAKMDKEKEE